MSESVLASIAGPNYRPVPQEPHIAYGELYQQLTEIRSKLRTATGIMYGLDTIISPDLNVINAALASAKRMNNNIDNVLINLKSKIPKSTSTTPISESRNPTLCEQMKRMYVGDDE